MSFGDTLRARRLGMGWTQQQLGKLVGKTKNNISQYELGKREPDFAQLAVFARLFGVTVGALLGGEADNTLREPGDAAYDCAPVLLPVYDRLPPGPPADRRYAAGDCAANDFYFIAPESAGRVRRGDLLLVEPRTDWTEGPLFLLARGGRAVLRTVKPCADGQVWLIPADQNAPPEMAARSEITCIGRVLRAEFSLDALI